MLEGLAPPLASHIGDRLGQAFAVGLNALTFEEEGKGGTLREIVPHKSEREEDDEGGVGGGGNPETGPRQRRRLGLQAGGTGGEKRHGSITRGEQKESALDAKAREQQEGSHQRPQHRPGGVRECDRSRGPCRAPALRPHRRAHQCEERAGEKRGGKHQGHREPQNHSRLHDRSPDRESRQRVGQGRVGPGGESAGREGKPGKPAPRVLVFANQEAGEEPACADAEEHHRQHDREGKAGSEYEEQEQAEPHHLEGEKESAGEESGHQKTPGGGVAFGFGLRHHGDAGLSRLSRHEQHADDGGGIERHRAQGRAAYTESLDQERLARQRSGHRTQRVPAVEHAEHSGETRLAGGESSRQHRQRGAHRRRGNQQQGECEHESDAVQQQRRVEERGERGRKRFGQAGKQNHERQPRGANRRLERCVDDQRAPWFRPPPAREGIADGQTSHEAGGDERGGPDAVAKHQAGLTEPQRFEDQRSRARKEEDEA